ncbi:MAG: hypothetical protein ACFFCF_02935 [Promethearchaeota archaeon]
MSDPMTRLTQATMDLKKYTSVFNYWAFLVIVIYVVLLVGGIFFPGVFVDPFLAIIAGITLFFVVLAFVAVFFVKDTQKGIILTLLRAIIGALLPLALILLSYPLGPLVLYLRILGIILFLIGLILLYLLFRPILTMNAITKELMKPSKAE